MTEIDLTHTVRSLSLGPVTPVKSRLPYRQSVQDSEDQAAGIFSLYGGARDSWQSTAGGQDTPENASSQPAGHNGHTNGTTHATIDEEHGREGLEQEELESEPRSPVSWDGPMPALSNGKSIRLSGIPLAPAISVTADNTPERRSVISPIWALLGLLPSRPLRVLPGCLSRLDHRQLRERLPMPVKYPSLLHRNIPVKKTMHSWLDLLVSVLIVYRWDVSLSSGPCPANGRCEHR
jgi:hypothetical protein